MPEPAPPVPRRLSPRAAQIVVAARRVLEEEGAEALTMRRLAEDLQIRAPSLYKHLDGKHAIEVAMIEVVFAELGVALHAAMEDKAEGGTPLRRVLGTYRRMSLAQPNLYRLATSGVLPREDLTPGLEEWAGECFFLVTGDPSLAQALWSFAHGMVILEIDGRYPPGSDLDATWAAGAAAFELAERGRRQRRRIEMSS